LGVVGHPFWWLGSGVVGHASWFGYWELSTTPCGTLLFQNLVVLRLLRVPSMGVVSHSFWWSGSRVVDLPPGLSIGNCRLLLVAE